ncbi:ParB/RepB/Spo0J family partition protein [Puniceibacterium confluentis]|uniref:ParB/RepB/Spo0J family partition protein n=1 Tax=Puniceibacterium confluentis TaxID=1958944 RepID=UPI0011B84399|nr:ParB N-terminal domain-containing protein [Puniceibacterium confluentis]
MAKRKRLTPANPVYLDEPPAEAAGIFARPAPIADVARAASSTAAFEEMADTLTRARSEGRMVLELPLDGIDITYLVRDRVVVEDAEMAALRASLRARGQQAPIEVTDLGAGRYGLISGWRRCQALRQLADETGEARFTSVLALLRRPDQASDAYLAMVEENEIRVGLSYYERARIVLKAVEQGVFETRKTALQQLFHAASRAKRSKIGSFLGIVEALDGVLRFPQALAERAGLSLSRALEDDPALSARLHAALTAAAPQTAEDEQAVLQAALVPPEAAALRPDVPPDLPAVVPPARPRGPDSRPARPDNGEQIAPDLWLHQHGSGALTLSGPALTAELRAALVRWLQQ